MASLIISPTPHAAPGSPALAALEKAYDQASKSLMLPNYGGMAKYLAAQGVGVIPAVHDRAIKDLEHALCLDDADAIAKAAWSLINAWEPIRVFCQGDRVRRKAGDTSQGIVLSADERYPMVGWFAAGDKHAYAGNIEARQLVLIEADN
jgi:hypothetical protein